MYTQFHLGICLGLFRHMIKAYYKINKNEDDTVTIVDWNGNLVLSNCESIVLRMHVM